MHLRLTTLFTLMLVWTGCGGCTGIGCQHPLSLDLLAPSGVDGASAVSLTVDYDGNQRIVLYEADTECEVTCVGEPCSDEERDVSVSTSLGTQGELVGIEFAVGHMSTRDGESSCRGAEHVSIEVRVGDTVFQPVELADLSYERDDEYGGGPRCGVADRSMSQVVMLRR